MAEMYTYQVARVRARELNLLSRQDIDSLMAAKTYDECLRVLADKGWGDSGEKKAEAIFAAENKKTWEFIDELIKDKAPFEVLFYPTDFNNLKAAIKLCATNASAVNVFKDGGLTDPDDLMTAVKNNDFSSLPKYLAVPGEKAYKTLLQTRDGQLCDVILDKASLTAVSEAGKASKDKLIRDYAELSVAISNIKIAIRCQKTGKNLSFISEALAECGSLNISSLAVAATKSLDDIFTYLSTTNYSGAIDALKEGFSSFEKWCDDKMMDLIKGQKSNPFTLGPIMAYIIARQNEINTVRIILSGKLNSLDDKIIRERLRDMYV